MTLILKFLTFKRIFSLLNFQNLQGEGCQAKISELFFHNSILFPTTQYPFFKFKTFSYYIIKTCQTYLWMFDIDISRFHFHSSRGQHCLQDSVNQDSRNLAKFLEDSWDSSKFHQGFLGFLMGFRDSFRPCIFPFIAFCSRMVDIQAPCWPSFFISSMRQLIALI